MCFIKVEQVLLNDCNVKLNAKQNYPFFKTVACPPENKKELKTRFLVLENQIFGTITNSFAKLYKYSFTAKKVR